MSIRFSELPEPIQQLQRRAETRQWWRQRISAGIGIAAMGLGGLFFALKAGDNHVVVEEALRSRAAALKQLKTEASACGDLVEVVIDERDLHDVLSPATVAGLTASAECADADHDTGSDVPIVTYFQRLDEAKSEYDHAGSGATHTFRIILGTFGGIAAGAGVGALTYRSMCPYLLRRLKVDAAKLTDLDLAAASTLDVEGSSDPRGSATHILPLEDLAYELQREVIATTIWNRTMIGNGPDRWHRLAPVDGRYEISLPRFSTSEDGHTHSLGGRFYPEGFSSPLFRPEDRAFMMPAIEVDDISEL